MSRYLLLRKQDGPKKFSQRPDCYTLSRCRKQQRWGNLRFPLTFTYHGLSSGTAYWNVTAPGNKFNIGDYVLITGTGSAGLNLRSCANTICSLVVNMPNGTVMRVIGGPTAAAGYTWWYLSSTVSGVGRTGWAVQDYLTK